MIIKMYNLNIIFMYESGFIVYMRK